MFGNFDMSKMGEMLQEAQKQAKQMEEESANKSFCAKSGGGMVKVSASGKGEIVDIEIDDSLLEDKESLQILLISATNDVLNMVEADKKNSAAQMLSKFGGFA